MRLPKVHAGHPARVKLLLGVIRLMSRTPVPGVVRTLLYRGEFFGGRMRALTHDAMRGPSAWTVGERELFAAFVSQLNQCVF
jgi:hypothetical protein